MTTNGNGRATAIRKAPQDMQEVGATGLRQYGGYLSEEILQELTGVRGKRVLREMSDNDPVIGSLLFAIDMLIRQVVWRVEPDQEDPNGQERAQFVEECLHDMSQSWDDTLSSILSFLPYGYSLHEIVYKIRRGPDEKDGQFRSHFTDGLVGWRKLPIRSQDTIIRWEFDEEGGIAGAVQVAPPHYVPTDLPIERCLLFRTTAQKNNPEGRSALRNAYRPWFFKKRIEEIEAIGIERDLAGFPVAYVPARLFSNSATADDQAVLDGIKKIVRNVKRDEEEGLVFPAVYDDKGNLLYRFELLTTGGRRQFDTDATIGRYDQRIAMTVLADFILLGHEKVGSFALGGTKADMFNLALGAWCDATAEVFNAHAIPRLFQMNGWDSSMVPRLTHEAIDSIDLDAVSQFVERLAGAAVLTPDPAMENWARETLGLPPSETANQEL